MKKVIGIMLIGLLSIFSLTGCGDEGKLTGTYQGNDPMFGEHRYILKTQDDGYQLYSQNKNNSSKQKEFEAPRKSIFLKKEGNYLVRSNDNQKFFEIIDENRIKYLLHGNIYKRINDEEN